MITRLLPFTIGLLLVGMATTTAAQTTDVVFTKGAVYREPKWDDRQAHLTFGPTALTVVIAGPVRVFHRGASQTITIPYADILSVRFDPGPADHRYVVIRYRHELDGAAVELDLAKKVAHRILATLEARSGIRITEP